MKKLLFVFIAAVSMSFFMISCAGETKTDGEETNADSTKTEVVTETPAEVETTTEVVADSTKTEESDSTKIDSLKQ